MSASSCWAHAYVLKSLSFNCGCAEGHSWDYSPELRNRVDARTWLTSHRWCENIIDMAMNSIFHYSLKLYEIIFFSFKFGFSNCLIIWKILQPLSYKKFICYCTCLHRRVSLEEWEECIAEQSKLPMLPTLLYNCSYYNIYNCRRKSHSTLKCLHYIWYSFYAYTCCMLISARNTFYLFSCISNDLLYWGSIVLNLFAVKFCTGGSSGVRFGPSLDAKLVCSAEN